MPAFWNNPRLSLAALLSLVLAAPLVDRNAARAAEPVAATTQERAFLKQHCVSCHEGAAAEAGLDLTVLGDDLSDNNVEKRWVRIFDRVHEGEMPPKDSDQPTAADREAFLQTTGDRLRSAQLARDAELGRVRARRLTRREVERSLHALLGIDIPLVNELPEEMRSSGFTTVADGQSMSHFQLERHLAAVDLALDEAFRRCLSSPDRYELDLEPADIVRRNPRVRCREPELRQGLAATWSSGLIFYGRLPSTAAPDDGWYRFTATVSALKPPETGGVWTTIHTGLCVSSAPMLSYVTAFEATEQPKTIEFTAWLPRKHMLEIRPGDITLRRARFQGGQVGVGEGEPQDVPGIAIHGLTMSRVHPGADDDDLRRKLIGDLRYETGTRKSPGRIVAKSPKADVARLVRDMATRAFRRPVTDEQVGPYVQMAVAALDQGESFTQALRVGYRAVLCSPRFLYLTETPGVLDSYAVAARLSYFLTGGPPDAELAKLAADDRLGEPEILKTQARRLLAGAGGRRFVEDFAAEWLDLNLIDFTEPDTKLYPRFDSVVKNSMLAETHAYLEEMLRENQGVERLAQSDYTYLNSRLARFYGVDGVRGDRLERVRLAVDSHRGGLMTQGAIMKVTANGSNTSPIVRGVWISERILGVPIPPPPSSVPAIEPDIRGATTIREQLAKHRSQESCAVCHRKIDPPGFALENFDPAGQWRGNYPKLDGKSRKAGPVIDSSYVTADGRPFADGEKFRDLVAADPKRLAANVAEKLLIYGTGAPIGFADRDTVETIAEASKADGYGLRSIVETVVTSPVFLKK
jgi:mono/diheme cytochrome c family protein